MNLFPHIFTQYFETPDPAGGGGAGTATEPSTGQQPQGQPQSQGGAGFRQYFPNVPDEQWALIEPHLGQVQAYTTQLEQSAAPLKQILNQGYTPETITGLVNFDQQFSRDPLGMWLRLGEQLQQGQNGQQPAIHPDVDLEYLAALARGEDPDAGSAPTPGFPGADGADPSQGANPQVDQLVQLVQQQQAEIQRLGQELQQDRVQRQTQVQDAVFDRRMAAMREALKQGGWPEETLTDESLASAVIAQRGDFAKATKALLDQRSTLLKGFTQQRETTQQQPGGTTLPNGAPETPNRELPNRKKDDPWAKATKTGEARLKRLNQPG